MARREIYTRVYSPSSVGDIVSGKVALVSGEETFDQRLAIEELHREFRNHADRSRRVRTALVSVSNRIIDTVKRAYEKHLVHREPAGDIWIVFIEVPAARDGRVGRHHRAEVLARQCGHYQPRIFRHEIVFEWAVPHEYVLHEVSLQTLMARGLGWGKYMSRKGKRPQYISTRALQGRVSEDLRGHPWEVGLQLGFLAKAFGARAPGDWIAHQLWYDCVKAARIDNGIKLTDAHGCSEISRPNSAKGTVEEQIDRGIETALVDWWLEDLECSPEYEAAADWRDDMGDIVIWEQMDFWQTWYPAYDHKMFYPPCEVKGLSYDEEWEKMQSRCSEIEASVEREAVRIGL